MHYYRVYTKFRYAFEAFAASTEEWDPILSETALLESQVCKSGVFIAGDMNCASRDNDIWNQAAGTTIEERSSFKTCYKDRGLKETFAEVYPTNSGVFSYWSGSRLETR
jgi:exonuclease III